MTKWYKLKGMVILLLACLSSTVLAQIPAISSFSPSSGAVGTLVTIVGTDLSAPTAITIGGIPAVMISNTGTSLVAMVMPGTVSGVISTTTAGVTATSSGNFTVTASAVPNNQQGPKLVGSGMTGTTPTFAPMDLSADGNTAIIGAYNDDAGKGAVFFYTRTGGVWSQQGAKMIGTGAVGAAAQGWAVAISADGNTAVEGGYNDNGVGAIWVWTRSNGVWTQQGSKLVNAGSIGTPYNGYTVDISADGNTIINGGYNDNALNSNNSIGAAWVWTRSGNNWTQQAKLVGTGATGYAKQGRSLSLSADGNTALVGGNGDDGSNGAVWFFTRSGTTWTQQGNKVVATDNIGGAELGNDASISADGNTAVVAGYLDAPQTTNYKGAVWIFVRNGNTWSQQGNKLLGTNSSIDAGLGSSVDISADGNTVILGGQNDNNGTGAVWFFTRSNGVWSQYREKIVGAGSVSGASLLFGLVPGAPRQGMTVAISADGSTAMEASAFDNSQTGAVWALSNTPAPVISSFTPSSGPVGSLITFTGTNLDYAKEVTIGGVAAVVVSNTATTVVAMVMPGSATGAVSLTSSSGSSTATGTFTVTSVNAPNSQLNSKLTGTVGSTDALQGQSVFVSADGTTAIVGASGDNTGQGAAWIYTRSGESWTQQTKLVGTGNTGAARQGASVALSADGNTAVIGGTNDNGSKGAIWIFARSGVTWTQTGKYTGGTVSTGALLGYAVAISADGNTVMAGGYKDGSNKGAVWTFARNGATWSPQGDKIAGTGTVQLGYAVALNANGSTALLGANGAAGAAWVYNFTSGKWVQQTKLVGSGGSATTFQGSSVSLSADGNTAISGGPGNNVSNGAAWVFTRVGNVWSEQTKLIGTGNIGNAAQGQSVALSASGDIAIVGGNKDNNNQGKLWLYKRNSGTWTQSSQLVGTGNTGAAQQGFSVSLSADGTAAMSGGQANNTNEGAVWAYRFTPPPVITSFTPANAAAGGTVTLTGTNFNGATAVSFGGTAATSFIVVSNTSITAIVGAGTSGDISVTTAYGTGVLEGFGFLSSNANLSALALSSGTLDPVFDSATLAYTASVNNATTSVTITPTVTDANATLTVNNVAVTSGSASESITLNVGTNAITTVVTAQDGTTTKSYTVTITRAPSANANLSALTLSDGILDPVFDSATLAYAASVSNATNSVTVTPTVSDITATVKVNGTAVTSGTASSAITLNLGANSLTTVVTAEDGTTVKTYTVTVTRDKFTPTITFADISKTYGDADTTPGATSDNSNTTISYSSSNTAVATIVNGKIHIVGVGTTNITASQAADATNYAATDIIKTFTVVKKALTVTLNSIPAVTKIYDNTTSATLSADNYTLNGKVGTDDILVSGTASYDDANAGTGKTIAVNNFVLAGAAQNNYTLNTAIATITGNISKLPLTVKADEQSKTYGDKDPVLTYRITSGALVGTNAFNGSPIRDVGENSGLYTIKQGTLELTSNYMLTYSEASLAISKKSLTITASNQSKTYGTPNPPLTATYSGFINGDNQTGLTNQVSINTTATTTTLPGNYPITVSGATSTNYDIKYVNGTLTIISLNNANMSNLSISSGTLTPAFSSGTNNYTATVTNAITSLVVTPTTANNATIMVNGTAVTSGSASADIPLTVGANIITITITAQDGVTTNTYSVLINRMLLVDNITATNILSPNGDGKNDTWAIKDILLYPNNKVTVYDKAGRSVYSKEGYTNDWNGTIRGAPLSQGTYYYVVQLGPGLPNIKGFITIFKSN